MWCGVSGLRALQTLLLCPQCSYFPLTGWGEGGSFSQPSRQWKRQCPWLFQDPFEMRFFRARRISNLFIDYTSVYHDYFLEVCFLF